MNLSPFTKDFRAVEQHYRQLYFSVVLFRGHSKMGTPKTCTIIDASLGLFVDNEIE